MLTAKRSPAGPVTDPAESDIAPQAPALLSALPAELEARIAAFEIAAPTSDFDGASWFWMILLGIAIPLVLLVVGWWA
jgi:hypothetical protein